jgi:hypothetical protein
MTVLPAVMTNLPWELSQISERARAKRDRAFVFRAYRDQAAWWRIKAIP